MTEALGFTTKAGFVERALREAIGRGELKPGDWLRTEDWAARLGVSPTPVREALGKLEAIGLVKMYPHRGAQVARFDLDEFAEVYQIRAVLEALAVRLAMQACDGECLDDLVRVLEAAYERMLEGERAGDGDAVRSANYEFHMTLYAAARAPRLEAIIRNLWATFPWNTLSLVHDRSLTARHEHAAMLDAIREHDGERLAALVAQHIELASQGLLASASAVKAAGRG